MLNDNEAIATIAVKDLKRAEAFYTKTLGLKRGSGSKPTTATFTSGRSQLLRPGRKHPAGRQPERVTRSRCRQGGLRERGDELRESAETFGELGDASASR